MSSIAAPSIPEQAFPQFQALYNRKDYAAALRIFTDALTADPEGTYRHFAWVGGSQLADTICACGRQAEIVGLLDGLLARCPQMHVMCQNDPAAVEFAVKMRNLNINAGLPSILLISQGKSASITVANIFNAGFDLQSIAYSLLTLELIPSWLEDYARGGACYVTHLDPSAERVARLKHAGFQKLILHLRDPRQAFLSAIHHLDAYPDQLVYYRGLVNGADSMDKKALQMAPYYLQSVKWIQSWISLEDDIEIMYSTHEQLVADPDKFVERYLDFYGVDRELFSYRDAMNQRKDLDFHLRVGRTNEWREVFSPEVADRLSAHLPEALKQRFDWPD
jgi:hypothetical protein